jgi:hypothetical protein
MRKAGLAGLILVLAAALGVGAVTLLGLGEEPPAANPTADFLANLDLSRYEQNGTDYSNPAYSPLRLGKPLQYLDPDFDYDFPRLEQTEARLKGVERQPVLRHIFTQVCAGAGSDTERHIRVLKFLHKAEKHAQLQPMYPDRTMVLDPLVLLELSEARCGQVARIAVDLFEAAGYRARLVQAGCHVLTEVYYDSGWHYFDGDLFGNGETVTRPDGTIPSMAELSRTPAAIDALAAYWDHWFQNQIPLAPKYYPSYYYFGRASYTTEPLLYYKQAGPAEAQASRYYGWDCYTTEVDHDRKLWDDRKPLRPPGAPFLQELHVEPAGPVCWVFLGWRPSEDPDGDLAGYRVFVSRQSRGWGYDGASLAAPLLPFKSHPEGGSPDQYEARYQLPGGEVATIDTPEASVRLTLASPGKYYLSVMPYDLYGLAVGRKLFPPSEELRLVLPGPAGGFPLPAEGILADRIEPGTP